MQLQSSPTLGNCPFPLSELEQIEAAIGSAQNWLTTLQSRRDALIAELDRITRPSVLAAFTESKTIGPGIKYRGSVYRHWNYIDIHIALLTMLWTDFPDQREAMATSIARCGNSRTYISKTRDALFPGQSRSFAERHSRPLVDGWYIDTNLNRERMCRILPAAVRGAGLSWGEDVRVYWRATKVE